MIETGGLSTTEGYSLTGEALKRQEKGIKSITLGAVDERIRRQHDEIKQHQRAYISSSRGIKEYLDDKSTYAVLPEYKGNTTKKIIASLKAGSSLLDVACGKGRFLDEVESINKGIIVRGYDGLRRDILIDKDHFIEGKLNDLSPETFGMLFDVVTNVATSYHAEGYYADALQAMTSVLKLNGLLVISSLSRAVIMDFYNVADKYERSMPPETIIEDRNGKILQDFPDPFSTYEGNTYESSQDTWSYGRCAGVFRTDGTLVFPADYFSFLERESGGGFSFQYSVGNCAEDSAPGIDGKLVVEKLEDAELNLKNVFYATLEMPEFSELSDLRSRLCYVIAENTGQAEELQANGFVSVGSSRLRNNGASNS